MPDTLDVILAGELFVDLIMSDFDFWPKPGQEAFARRFQREIGGGAAITACGLARLGTTAGLVGVAGEDTGPWLAERLRQCGVDTSGIQIDPVEPTAFTVVASTPEDRAFLTYTGANCRFAEALARAAAARRFAAARHVHLAFAPDLDDFGALLDAIRRDGCRASLDVGWHERWLRDPRALASLASLDIFFPNLDEAAVMTGESEPERALRRFEAAGVKRVALKLGACGAALLWDAEILFAPGLAVDAVDTTGAGDCFNAGFLHAWLAGSPPDVCLRTANLCGALSTEAFGGIAAFPSRERIEGEWKRQP